MPGFRWGGVERSENCIHVGADSVITGTAALNIASCRLLERLGFRKTAESRGSFTNGPDGKPIELLRYSYSLPKEEWTNYANCFMPFA